MSCTSLPKVPHPHQLQFIKLVFSIFLAIHGIRFSDLVDLWVIKIRKPMILCARSTSRSREQSTKHRSRSENVRKFCLSYNIVRIRVRIRRLYHYQTWQTHFHGVRKGLWAFFLIAFGLLIGWAGDSTTLLIYRPS